MSRRKASIFPAFLPKSLQRLAAFRFPHEHRIAALEVQNESDTLLTSAYAGFVNGYVIQTFNTFMRMYECVISDG
jgi:hypothetical protein